MSLLSSFARGGRGLVVGWTRIAFEFFPFRPPPPLTFFYLVGSISAYILPWTRAYINPRLASSAGNRVAQLSPYLPFRVLLSRPSDDKPSRHSSFRSLSSPFPLPRSRLLKSDRCKFAVLLVSLALTLLFTTPSRPSTCVRDLSGPGRPFCLSLGNTPTPQPRSSSLSLFARSRSLSLGLRPAFKLALRTHC